MIETFHMRFEDILWKYDYPNLKLLMQDKLHYVGEDKGKKRSKKQNKKDEFEEIRELIKD